jgi:hypothetical protein
MSVVQEYKQGLKSVAVEEVLDLIFYRPLAFLLVKGVYSTPITPNQLTFVSMIFGVLGGVCFAFGTPLSFCLGGVLFIICDVVDCSDGQLARMKKGGTPVGRILDGLADYVSSLSAYLGIGIGYASASSQPLVLWLVTAFVAFSNVLQASLLDFYRNRYLDVTLNRTSVLVDGQKAFEEEYAALRGKRDHIFEKALLWIYLKYSAVQKRFTSDQKTTGRILNTNPEVFAREQKWLMRLWTYLGPTTQFSLMIVCAFLNRWDIYFWGIAGVGNVLAGVLIIAQRLKDRSMNLYGMQ